ncbi:MAG: hypothetical protein ABIV50_04810, partial [Opitutus sp.]
MPTASLIFCPLILLSLAGCVSHVAERAAAEDLVRRDVIRLGEEQGRWLLAVEASRERVERILAEKRKLEEVKLLVPGDAIVARMEVISMA